MKVRLIVAAAALTFAAHAYAGDTVTFRDVPIGATMDEFKAAQPTFDCGKEQCTLRPERNQSIETTRERMAYGGATAKWIDAKFYDGKLGSIHVDMPSGWFDRVTTALVEKFGAPSEEQHPEWKNRAGAVLTNTVLVWRIGETTITARKMSSTIDESTVFYISDSAAAAYGKRQAESAKADAKAL